LALNENLVDEFLRNSGFLSEAVSFKTERLKEVPLIFDIP